MKSDDNQSSYDPILDKPIWSDNGYVHFVDAAYEHDGTLFPA
jgi:hypothetical protein